MTLIVVMLAVGWPVALLAQQESAEPVYRFDPALSLAEPRLPAIARDPQSPPLVVDQNGRQTNLRLQTETPLSPYLGAERAPELSLEERRLLPLEQAREGLGGYRLEAGVGLHVEDKASLSLGYRFSNPPSLLDERRNDPLTLSGDLRITFDVKLPFD